MEQEYFLSGYCRTVDGSRMVTAVVTGGKLDEVDCCYPDCPYVSNCQIARKIEALLKD